MMGSLSNILKRLYLFQLVMCGTGDISVSDMKAHHIVICGFGSWNKVTCAVFYQHIHPKNYVRIPLIVFRSLTISSRVCYPLSKSSQCARHSRSVTGVLGPVQPRSIGTRELPVCAPDMHPIRNHLMSIQFFLVRLLIGSGPLCPASRKKNSLVLSSLSLVVLSFPQEGLLICHLHYKSVMYLLLMPCH